MSFWDILFGSKKKSNLAVHSSFTDWVQATIEFIGKQGPELEDGEIVQFIVSQGASLADAHEILLFLPSAFTQKLLPALQWRKSYYDCYAGGRTVRKRYADNEQYLVISQIAAAYFEHNPDPEVILKIAGRSAEFQVVNKILLNGGRLEDIKLTEVHLVR